MHTDQFEAGNGRLINQLRIVLFGQLSKKEREKEKLYHSGDKTLPIEIEVKNARRLRLHKWFVHPHRSTLDGEGIVARNQHHARTHITLL